MWLNKEWVLVIVSILIPIVRTQTTQSTLTPNYDYPDEKVKIFNIKRSLQLECIPSVTGEYDMTWKKDGNDVTSLPELKGRFTAQGNVFHIKETVESDAATYECSISMMGLSAVVVVIAKVDVKLETNSYVVEGEALRITCKVVGTKPEILWRVGTNETDIYTESRGRVTLEAVDGVPNARFIMNETTMLDRNEYTCVGQNNATKLLGVPEESTTFVRVKDKYAAFWPFIGICLEVLVLCIVIWFCEKRRLKKEMDESDDEDESERSNGRNSSAVRQRRQ